MVDGLAHLRDDAMALTGTEPATGRVGVVLDHANCLTSVAQRGSAPVHARQPYEPRMTHPSPQAKEAATAQLSQ